MTLAELNYAPKVAAVACGKGGQRARTLPRHACAFVTKLSSKSLSTHSTASLEQK